MFQMFQLERIIVFCTKIWLHEAVQPIINLHLCNGILKRTVTFTRIAITSLNESKTFLYKKSFVQNCVA